MKKSYTNAHPTEFQEYDGIIQRPQDPANPKSSLRDAMSYLYVRFTGDKNLVN